MAEVPNPRPRCSVCKSPYKNQYHALRASGMRLEDIAEQSKKLGRSIKRTTFGAHFRICLNGATPEVLAQEIADASKGELSQVEMDFAILVQKRATDLLRSGDLRVTASHGLAAQALLDRRAEKQADRELALNMARLLSGSMTMPPITVIDSRAIEVDQLTDGLAPPGVYEPIDA